MSRKRHKPRKPLAAAKQPPAVPADLPQVPDAAGGCLAKWRVPCGGVLIFVLVLAVYWPAMRGEFQWSDVPYVAKNEMLRSWQGLSAIWFRPQDYRVQYYPLTYASLWCNYAIGGLDPFNYRLTNVAVHALNALLIWLLLRRLQVAGAFVAALLFALHPVHIESVSWICERKNVLSLLFMLLSLLAWDGWLQQRRGRLLAAALGAFLLGILSKTVLIMLVPVLLLWVWWRAPKPSRTEFLWVIPFLLLAAAMLPVTAWGEARHIGKTDYGLSVLDSCTIAGHAVWFYVGKLLWPAMLMNIYPRWVVHPLQWQWLLAGLAFCLGLALLWRARGRLGRGPFVAVLTYLIIIFPVLGFLKFGFMGLSFVADHYLYHPCVPLLALATTGAAHGLMRIAPAQAIRRYAVPLTVLTAAPLAVLTWKHNHVYRTQEAFWSYNLAVNPTDTAAGALGDLYLRRNDTERAVPLVRQSLALRENARGHFRLGEILVKEKKWDEAMEEFERAMDVNQRISKVPDLEERALFNLGVIHWKQRQWSAAAEDWERLLALRPDHKGAAEWLAKAKKRMTPVAALPTAPQRNPGAHPESSETRNRRGDPDDPTDKKKEH